MTRDNDNDLDNPLDELIGEIFDIVQDVPQQVIEQEGHTTLDGLRWETPFMEESWHIVRKVLLAMTPVHIERLKRIRQI